MSQYYNARRTRNVYDPKSLEVFSVSRSKIDLWHDCPRCFYLDRRLGVGRPPGYPFNLNSAVDTLLKKEFDIHRVEKSRHPLMESYGIDAVPFEHAELDVWRENFKGVRFHHEATNFVVTGAVDDVWINPAEELIVVDYKATSKNGEVSLDAPWQDSYKRQMEVYQWLLRKNDFTVSDTGYFVYCNGKTDRQAFDAKLEFDVVILPYTGNDDWIDGALTQMKDCLDQEKLPNKGTDCDYCEYRLSATGFEV